jgi:hypothetical protein
MDELYRKYGELMIQAEIIQAKINQLKQQIAEELNKKENENG